MVIIVITVSTTLGLYLTLILHNNVENLSYFVYYSFLRGEINLMWTRLCRIDCLQKIVQISGLPYTD